MVSNYEPCPFYAAKVCAECHHYYNTEDVVIFLDQVGINSSMIIARPSAILCVCMFLQSVRPAPDANVYVFPIHVIAFPSSSVEDLPHNLGPYAILAPVLIELLVKVAKEIYHSRLQLITFISLLKSHKQQCKALCLCRVKEIDINIGEARSTQTIVNLYPITSVVIVYQIICEL